MTRKADPTGAASWAVLAFLVFGAVACGNPDTESSSSTSSNPSNTGGNGGATSSGNGGSGGQGEGGSTATSTNSTTSTTTSSTASSSSNGGGDTGGAGATSVTSTGAGSGGQGGDTTSSTGGQGGAGSGPSTTTGSGASGGTGGMATSSTTSSTAASGGSTTSSTTTSSSTSSSSSGGGGPVQFSCDKDSWVSDPGFESFLIDGTTAKSHNGAVLPVSANSVYALPSTNAKAVVAHSDGTTWTQQTTQVQLTIGSHLWTCPGSNKIWLAGKDDVQGRLLYELNGSGQWIEDSNEPSTIDFRSGSCVGAANYALGTDYPGHSALWLQTGTIWAMLALPSLPQPFALNKVTALSSGEVFVTGYRQQSSSSSTKVGGVLLYFNGVSWSDKSSLLPSSCVETVEISCAANSDCHMSAMNASGQGEVYHLVGNMGSPTLTPVVSGSKGVYRPIYSKYPGAFLTGGTDPTAPHSNALLLTTAAPTASEYLGAYAAINFAYQESTNTMFMSEETRIFTNNTCN